MSKREPWMPGTVKRNGRRFPVRREELPNIRKLLECTRAHSDKVHLHFRKCASECALVSLRLSHFLRKTGVHFSGKCSSAPIPKFASYHGETRLRTSESKEH